MSTTNNTEKPNHNTVFVVYRDNHQVSDKEYRRKEDAQPEVDYWLRILKKWPDGSKITIREFPAKS